LLPRRHEFSTLQATHARQVSAYPTFSLARHVGGVHSSLMNKKASGESRRTQDVFLDVFDNAPTRDLAPGEILISAGAPADHVFNALDGMLMLSRNGGDGRRQVLSFLFRDNFVGITATDHYFFTVEAVTKTRVACCSRRTLMDRLASDPIAENTFIKMMFRVLEDILDVVYNLGQRNAHERLAVFLLYLRHWQRLSEQVENDNDPVLDRVGLPMSREDIADFLGLKKETVSRSFRYLEDKGLIERESSHQVLITALDSLRQTAGVRDFSSRQRPGIISA
jgi:CRP/FNR family transcriptional regulator